MLRTSSSTISTFLPARTDSDAAHPASVALIQAKKPGLGAGTKLSVEERSGERTL